MAIRASKTALFAAAKSWDAETVAAILAEDANLVRARDARGRVALHLCAAQPLSKGGASERSVETAKALLHHGADIDAVHEIADDAQVFPATALWYAVARGINRPLVQFMLKRGANPDYCLWAVVWSSDVETARMLLKAGSNTELRFDGETPLLYAARLGRESMVLELLKAKANARVQDSKGKSPVDYALKKRLSQSTISALRVPAK